MALHKKLYADTETTGTNPKENGLLQFSGILTMDFIEVDYIDLKIQPFPQDKIEDSALEANGLTRIELFSSDRIPPEQAYKEITGFLKKHIDNYDIKDKAFFLGYKAPFDSDFLREFMIKNGDNYYGSFFWTPPLCIMSLAGHLLQRIRPQLPNFKLKTVWEALHQDRLLDFQDDEWHDSLFDIRRTMEVEDQLRRLVTGTRSMPVLKPV